MHHRTIQINHQPDATIFQFLILMLFTAQHVSGVFPAITRSSMTAVAASGFIFVSWWWSCCVRGRVGRPDREHSTAITTIRRGCYCSHELLMMGGRTPETCWAVKKRQDNKLLNCCFWLVIYLNCTMMHGLTNIKFKKVLWIYMVLHLKKM